MTRAAIYCRYSSDLQNEKSIEDQERSCRAVAERNGWRVAGVYADRAISGASTINRPDWQSLMRAAEAREFGVIVIEDIDRAFRSEAGYHAAREALNFLEIKIHSVAGGEITPLEGSIRALMSAAFIENLAHKVRRGLAGVVHSGRHAGGRAYGYRPIPGKPGELAIDETEAEIVRRIFVEYAAGESPRAICARLNREGVKPPRGQHWQPSSLNGSRQRHSGILANDLYIGRIVWNKVRMARNPATGKRVSRPNPPSEWQSTDAPHLRIVDQELWDRAQARRPKIAGQPLKAARRPRHLFSGLLRCGSCGAPMTLRGADRKGVRVSCAQYRDTGTCRHSRRYYVAEIERMALAGLREHLLSPAALDRFLETYRAERKRLAGEGTSRRQSLERRAAEIARKIGRATAAILDSDGPTKALTAAIAALEAEKEAIEADLAAIEESRNVVALHPAVLDRYREKVSNLDLDNAGELRDAVRELVHRIIVQPSAAGDPITLDIEGKLAPLIMPGATSIRSVGEIGGSGGSIQPISPTNSVLVKFRLIA